MSDNRRMALPYVNLLEGRDPIVLMRETPGRVADLLKPMDPAAIDHKPAPGKWSIREILCHLADCEIAWGWRLRQVYAAPDIVLQPFDQDEWAKAYEGPGYTVSVARSTWTALRQWNVAFIESLQEPERQRKGTHAEHGPITVWNLVEIAAGHDLHHLRGLEAMAAPTLST